MKIKKLLISGQNFVIKFIKNNEAKNIAPRYLKIKFLSFFIITFNLMVYGTNLIL